MLAVILGNQIDVIRARVMTDVRPTPETVIMSVISLRGRASESYRPAKELLHNVREAGGDFPIIY